jgi:hypothetical protein
VVDEMLAVEALPRGSATTTRCASSPSTSPSKELARQGRACPLRLFTLRRRQEPRRAIDVVQALQELSRLQPRVEGKHLHILDIIPPLSLASSSSPPQLSLLATIEITTARVGVLLVHKAANRAPSLDRFDCVWSRHRARPLLAARSALLSLVTVVPCRLWHLQGQTSPWPYCLRGCPCGHWPTCL